MPVVKLTWSTLPEWTRSVCTRWRAAAEMLPGLTSTTSFPPADIGTSQVFEWPVLAALYLPVYLCTNKWLVSSDYLCYVFSWKAKHDLKPSSQFACTVHGTFLFNSNMRVIVLVFSMMYISLCLIDSANSELSKHINEGGDFKCWWNS